MAAQHRVNVLLLTNAAFQNDNVFILETLRPVCQSFFSTSIFSRNLLSFETSWSRSFFLRLCLPLFR